METGSREAFARMGTVGVEEEFFVVDAAGRPTSGTDELVYGATPPDPLVDRLDHELFQCTIETETPTLAGPDGIEAALTAAREALVEHAASEGYGIAAAGLHPAAKWRELDHARKERYRAQLERIQYPQHRNTTAGLHVHVGVDDADKATWIANELRWYVAPLLALSVNSPFWCGFDTGLASARAKVFEGLPNTGIPTHFADFDAFDRFKRRMLETGAIDDRGELWYDVRPLAGHGTVEVRATRTASRRVGSGGSSSTRTSGARSATAGTPRSSTPTPGARPPWRSSSPASATASGRRACARSSTARAGPPASAACARPAGCRRCVTASCSTRPPT